MRQQFIRQALINQIISFRKSFAQDDERLFDGVLPLEEMLNGLEGITYRNRLFSPVVTLRYFLFQVLSADHSCREVVGQKIAEAAKTGEDPCSLNTASYCAARKRLSGEWVLALLRRSGKELHKKSFRLWRGRSVKLVDGTTVSMPDTPENQKAYPQIKSQKAGIGFPIARLVGIISLSCGAILDIAMGPCEGKGSGEHSLLRRIIGNLKKTTFWLATSITAAIG